MKQQASTGCRVHTATLRSTQFNNELPWVAFPVVIPFMEQTYRGHSSERETKMSTT